MKKIIDIGGCLENSLIKSFELIPNIICLGCHLRSLLWLAYESGLDVIVIAS